METPFLNAASFSLFKSLDVILCGVKTASLKKNLTSSWATQCFWFSIIRSLLTQLNLASHQSKKVLLSNRFQSASATSWCTLWMRKKAVYLYKIAYSTLTVSLFTRTILSLRFRLGTSNLTIMSKDSAKRFWLQSESQCHLIWYR